MRQHEITLHSIRTSQAWRRCSPKKVVSAYLKHVFFKETAVIPPLSVVIISLLTSPADPGTHNHPLYSFCLLARYEQDSM